MYVTKASKLFVILAPNCRNLLMPLGCDAAIGSNSRNSWSLSLTLPLPTYKNYHC